jgi:hypothetical protein
MSKARHAIAFRSFVLFVYALYYKKERMHVFVSLNTAKSSYVQCGYDIH